MSLISSCSRHLGIVKLSKACTLNIYPIVHLTASIGIQGKYGNGETRKTVLGGRYKAVQDKIDGKGSGAVYYTVRTGDTLSGIAAKYGTTYQKIAQMNGIANPNKIYAGQKIRVK